MSRRASLTMKQNRPERRRVHFPDEVVMEDSIKVLTPTLSSFVLSPSVRLSVGPSVGPSVTLCFFFVNLCHFMSFYVSLSHFKLFKVILSQFTFCLSVFWSFSLLVFQSYSLLVCQSFGLMVLTTACDCKVLALFIIT